MAHKNKSNISPYKTRRAAAGRKLGPKAEGQRDVQTSENSGEKRGQHRKAQVIYELEEASDRLYDLFRNHDFGDFPHEKRRQLAQYYRLLMLKQNQVNMTRLLTLREVGLKHFVDCLMIPRLTKLKFPLMDLGTGPGLPGIPLKIQFPDEKIVLAEGVQKRVEFLKEVREELQLKNLPIIGRNINPWCFYPVNGVITRAVEDVGNTLGNVIYTLQTGGRVYFMKGPGVDPEIDTALAQWKEHYKLVDNISYQLPESGLDRRLVIFEKIKPAEFPDLEDEPWPEGPDF